jgi:hypothetical protein
MGMEMGTEKMVQREEFGVFSLLLLLSFFLSFLPVLCFYSKVYLPLD